MIVLGWPVCRGSVGELRNHYAFFAKRTKFGTMAIHTILFKLSPGTFFKLSINGCFSAFFAKMAEFIGVKS